MSGPHLAIAATRLAARKALGEIGEASPGGLVLVACSGGADSLALAAAVGFEAPRVTLSAGAVVVDHDLQEGSRAVAERAADQCRGLGLNPVEVVTVRVGPPGSRNGTGQDNSWSGGQSAGGRSGGSQGGRDGNDGGSGTGSGPESRARDARYRAFEDVVERVGAVAVLLGHTRDDQAEQVLLGLARGSGARSLSGMPARRGPYVRPLLGVARATTAAACKAAGLAAWVDPQNSDPAFGRVRARALLPLLETELGPGAVVALARSADLLREDADALDDLATAALLELTRGQLDGSGLSQGGIEAEALSRLPRAIRTRVWRLLAIEAGCSPGALIASQIDSLDTLVTCWRGQGPIDLPGHLQGCRTDGRVVVAASRQVE